MLSQWNTVMLNMHHYDNTIQQISAYWRSAVSSWNIVMSPEYTMEYCPVIAEHCGLIMEYCDITVEHCRLIIKCCDITVEHCRLIIECWYIAVE